MARSLILASLLVLSLSSIADSTVPLAGQFRVSEQGAATYSLPIVVPKTRGGLQVQMALQYSSSGQNGLLGIGMGLSAVSAISRCPQTIAQDGAIKGIELTANDRFCLDGQRLVLAGGQYGADGSTYRKEIDDYSVITALGQAAAGGPLAFKVETKSGDTHYFGDLVSVLPTVNLRDAQGGYDTGDAAMVMNNRSGNQVVLSWAIKGTVDALGNYISYQYGVDSSKGEHWLKAIASGGHLSTGAAPYVEARVTYEANPRPRYGFVAGVPYSQSKLVKAIHVYKDGQLGARYALTYRKSNIIEEQVYLNTVTRCVSADNSDCSAPIIFSWLRPDQLTVSGTETTVDDITGRPVVREIPTQAFVPFASPVATSMPIDNRFKSQAFDMTGDGRTDLIYVKNGYWYLKSFDGITSQQLTHIGVDRAEHAMSINYDGDGQRDLLISDAASGNWQVISFKPSQVPNDMCEPLPQGGEVCNDFPRQLNYTLVNLGVASEGYSDNAMVADVNGDGLEDILFIKDKKIRWYKNNGGSFSAAQTLYTFATGFQASFQDPILTQRSANLKTSAAFDANGDGRTDLLLKITTDTSYCSAPGNDNSSNCADAGGTWHSSTDISWKLYVAGGSVASPNYSERQSLGYRNVNLMRTADFNGDGISDLMFLSNGQWLSRLGNGYGFEAPKETGITATETEAGRSQFVDLNGDGRTDMLRAVGSGALHIMMSYPLDSSRDMLWASRGVISVDNSRMFHFADTHARGQFDLYSADSSKWYRHASRQEEFENLVEAITDGYGVKTQITYSRLSRKKSGSATGEPDVYKTQVSTAEADPDNFSLLLPMVVVAEARTEVGEANSLAVAYEYGGLALNRKGRGMLGFELLRSRDLQSGVVTETQYHQAFPFIGLPKSTTQYLGDLTLSHAHTEYDTQQPIAGVYAVFAHKSWDKSYQIGSDGQQYPLAEVYTENTTIDSWGNIEDMVVQTTNLATGNVESRVRTESLYLGAGGGARMGRLSSSKVTRSRFGQRENSPELTRESSFTYYANGLLKTSVLSPADARYKSTTSYVYDAWGNTTKTSVTAATAADGTNVQTRSQYYQYDPRGRYLVSERNDLNEQINYSYNGLAPGLVTGWVTESRATDPNGFWVDKLQDAWGRQTGSLSKDGLSTSVSWALCSASADCGEYPDAYLLQTTTASGKPTEQLYYDRFGRVVGSRQQGFDSGDWIYKKTDYDAKGRPFKHFEPAYNGVSTLHATTLTYDDFNRVVVQVAPNGAIKSTRYFGLLSRVEDHYGNHTDYLKSASGDAYQVQDTYGSQLEYQYDSYGNLLKVWAKPANGAEVLRTSSQYDGYGRKVSTFDLDKGSWSYQYNAFGELLRQTNANGHQVNISYDLLGRKISRREPEGISCWTYGDSAQGDVGRLLSERIYHSLTASCTDQSPDAATGYGYDDLGRITSTEYRVAGAVYQTGQSYDGLSRPSVTSYPGGSIQVKHLYTGTGYLRERNNAVTGELYQRILSVDARGNPEEVVYGNGTAESRTYTPDTGWLETVRLQKSSLLHKLEYAFDKQGNLSRRDHQLSVAQASWTENYLYDDLFRLEDRVITVTLNGLGKLPLDFRSHQNYQYDDWGNIAYKSDKGYYQYDGNNPYRLLNICAEGACNVPAVTLAAASCPAGYSYNASAERCDKTESKPATVEYDYYCPVGYTLNATTGNCTKTETTAATASYSYTCAAGYSYNASAQRCEKPETKAAAATISPTCSSGYTYNSSTGDCRKTETQSATPSYTYSCPSGYSYSGSAGNCRKTETQSASVSYTYSCSSGWTLSGTSCSRFESKAATATQVLSCPSGYSYYGGGKCRGFKVTISATRPINAVSCSSAEPMGGGKTAWECILEVNQISTTTYSCDSGWTLSGSTCSRTLTQSATRHTNYSCSSGWTLSGSSCSRTLTAAATQVTSYSCTSGWALSGSNCTRTLTQSAGSETVYSCDAGWTLSGASCNRLLTAGATQLTSYSCAAGWTLAGSSCTRTLSAAQIADPVEQCPAGYNYNATSGNCQNHQTQAASSSTQYSCPAGYTRSGQTCTKAESKAANQGSVLVCPSGYSWSAATGTCRKFEIIYSDGYPTRSHIESCEGGEGAGGGLRMWECWVWADRISQTTYSCDTGWSLSGQTCSRTLTQAATTTTLYSCSAGWTLNGSSCQRTLTAAATIYQCEAGWTLNGSNCGRTLTAAASYSCPAGTSVVGSRCHRAMARQYAFAYDNQGNVLQDGSRTFTYTSYDLVSRIAKGAELSSFKYDASRNRYSRSDSRLEDGFMAVYQTTYVGGLYEKIERTGGGKGDLTEHKYYVGNAVITERSNGDNDIFYLHKDHQGSTTTVTDAQGDAVQQFVYDPWGKQTNVFVAGKLGGVISPAFTRGYTGHENLPHVDIIHMNGRIYDANIARFVQADPFVQSPSDFQNYNRYAYVKNNSMSYTDPSGFIFDFLAASYIDAKLPHPEFKYLAKNPGLAAVVQVAGSIVTTYYCGACSIGFNAWFSKNLTYASTGSLRAAYTQAAISGATTAAFYGIGASGWSDSTKVFAHAMVGGVSAELQGGKFGHGFISAGITKGADVAGFVPDELVSGTLVSAIIGGTTSAITGGKFANGARTAAFQYMLNSWLSGRMQGARQENAQKGGYDPNDPNYHRYDVESAICQVDSVCTMDSVALAGRMHPAPGMLSNTVPVVDGQISNAQVGYSGNFDDFGPVVHSVSSDGLTVRNTTLDGHKLFPGYVERTVFQRGNTIYIRTFGEGIGPMGAANEFFAKPLWNGLVDGHVRYRVNLGYRE